MSLKTFTKRVRPPKGRHCCTCVRDTSLHSSLHVLFYGVYAGAQIILVSLPSECLLTQISTQASATSASVKFHRATRVKPVDLVSITSTSILSAFSSAFFLSTVSFLPTSFLLHFLPAIVSLRSLPPCLSARPPTTFCLTFRPS